MAQFREYVERSGQQPEISYGLSRPANEPMVGVSWYDAVDFCRWLTAEWRTEGRLLGEEEVCLPSEAEWEKAARGTDGRIYPWGDGWEANRANVDETGIGQPNAVGCFPGGASPFGCEEMSGNVWEWARSLWGKAQKPDFPYPYVPGGEREDLKAGGEVFRVVRGGSAWADVRSARCAVRYWGVPTYQLRNFGFRLAVLPFSSGL